MLNYKLCISSGQIIILLLILIIIILFKFCLNYNKEYFNNSDYVNILSNLGQAKNNYKDTIPDFSNSENSIFEPSESNRQMFLNNSTPYSNNLNSVNYYQRIPIPENNQQNQSNQSNQTNRTNQSNQTNQTNQSNQSNQPNSFNSIIDNLQNGINDLNEINKNNCDSVINDIKSKINSLSNIIQNINHDLHLRTQDSATNEDINEQRHNVCPILLSNDYSIIN